MALAAASRLPRHAGAAAPCRALRRAPPPAALPPARRRCVSLRLAAADAAPEPEAAALPSAAPDPPTPPPKAKPSQPNLLDRALMRSFLISDVWRMFSCTSADALLDMAVTELWLNPVCTCAVLTRLVHLLAPGKPDRDEARQWLVDPRMCVVMAAAEMHQVKLPKIGVGKLLFSQFFNICELHGFEEPRKATGAPLAEMQAAMPLPPRSLTRRFFAVTTFHKLHAQLPPRDLARCMRLCARMGARPPAAWSAEAWSAVAQWLPRLSPGELSALLAGLHSVRAQPPPAEVLDVLWRSDAAAALRPAQKLAALEACAPGRTAPHAAWLDTFWDELASAVLARQLGAKEMVRALRACAKLHVLPPQPWMRLLWGVTADALATRAMRFEELPALLLACAELGAKPPEVWAEAMFDAAISPVEGAAMKAKHVSDLLLAIKKMRLQPPKGWYIKLLQHEGGAVSAR
jgi:hypothetical protein